MITTIRPIIQLKDGSANLYYYLIITTKDGRFNRESAVICPKGA